MDKNELLDLLLKENIDPKMITTTNDRSKSIVEGFSKRESPKPIHFLMETILYDYRTGTNREREKIVSSLSNWAFTLEFYWDTLIELVEHEPIIPLLKDLFIVPALREERKRPHKTKYEEDLAIMVAVDSLKKDYKYSLTKALKAIAEKRGDEFQTIRSKYRKMKNLQPFKKSKKPQ